jgi:hypothetical protein
MPFPVVSCSVPSIYFPYRNLYELATLGSDQDIRCWPDPTISSQRAFELLYAHNQDPTELTITEMRMCLLFAYYFTTW